MTPAQITFPKGYSWLQKQQLIGFKEFSQLQPWYYIPQEQFFWATEKWMGITEDNLLVFARRQDNDDLACFKVLENGTITEILLIHGWTSSGFEIIKSFSSFWEWLHSVIDDVEECVESISEDV